MKVAMVAFEAAHLRALGLPAPVETQVLAHAAAYAQSVIAMTALVDDRPVGCGGVVRDGYDHRGMAWALFAPDVPRRAWPAIARACDAAMDDLAARGMTRLAATVDTRFGKGCSFVRHLGFAPEGLMACWAPDGADHLLYARVRETRDERKAA